MRVVKLNGGHCQYVKVLFAFAILVSPFLLKGQSPEDSIFIIQDMYAPSYTPVNYIPLPEGTIYVRDTSLVKIYIDSLNVSYSDFSTLYSIDTIEGGKTQITIDSIRQVPVGATFYAYLYCRSVDI